MTWCANSRAGKRGRSEEAASLYEHCVRAILNSLKFGDHGLPLMGSGDWNDGMNLVGEHGKGESVWLGFFLYEVLMRFTEVANARGDISFVEHCQREATHLRRNLEEHGWDGEWYRRAWELFTMINPVNHARSTEETATYKVEPYVVAADVYAVPPHTGRGGWTWYTGSAAWMYRLIVESLPGLRLEVDIGAVARAPNCAVSMNAWSGRSSFS